MKKLLKKLLKKSEPYKEVDFHTGFYKFNKHCMFKLDGIPCQIQLGIDEFIFYSETDLTSSSDVISIDFADKYYLLKQHTNL
jgi:hypothetical protein